MRKNVIKKAFTLLELMVIMTVMTILLAALSPMFTGRANPSSDIVWHYVQGDRSDNAYSNPINSYLKSGFYIGIAPDLVDMALMDTARVTIRPSQVFNQPQMELGYQGEKVATIFVNPENTLFGSSFEDIITNGSTKPLNNNNAYGNTAYGIDALKSIKKAKRNTAIGYGSASEIKDQTDNTIIGTWNSPLVMEDSSNMNTIIGNFSDKDIHIGSENTIVGDNDGVESGTDNKQNTLIGKNAAPKLNAMNNTIIGSYAAPNLTTGTGNTIIGSASYKDADGITHYRPLSKGKNNTLIGVNSGFGLGPEAENKTCIGYGSCPKIEGSDYDKLGLLNDKVTRVFIGGPPRHADASQDFGGYAVLEVHNSPNKHALRHALVGDNIKAYDRNSFIINNGKGDESVIINGNLIVRGQTYLGGVPSVIFPDYNSNPTASNANNSMPLYGMSYDWVGTGEKSKVFYAKDGNKIADSVYASKKVGGYSPYLNTPDSGAIRRSTYYHKVHCTCAPEHTSYDWSSVKSAGGYSVADIIKYRSVDNPNHYKTVRNLIYSDEKGYTDESIGGTGIVKYNTSLLLDSVERDLYTYNFAHIGNQNGSCCPYLYTYKSTTSDARLKNIGKEFTDGLDKIKQLKVFNYTFKSDPNKTHNVGVIAQDLKKVFPNAVFKGKDGYYSIRWDEMFYAAINAVKEINSRVETLANRVNKDIERVKALKAENAQLAKKLEELAIELTALENKK